MCVCCDMAYICLSIRWADCSYCAINDILAILHCVTRFSSIQKIRKAYSHSVPNPTCWSLTIFTTLWHHAQCKPLVKCKAASWWHSTECPFCSNHVGHHLDRLGLQLCIWMTILQIIVIKCHIAQITNLSKFSNFKWLKALKQLSLLWNYFPQNKV